MTIILGIESTAHTFGIGIVRNGKVLANVKKTYTTETGGIIPMEAAKHHCQNKNEIYFEALTQAGIKQEDIDAIAFSQGPGLAPCLLEGMRFAKELAHKLARINGSDQTLSSSSQKNKVKGKNSINSVDKSRAKRGKFGFQKIIPLIPVNHCVAHLEIGKIVGCKNAVMLYASGANTQIIAYESGKYRIFGETLDIGVGNFIDTFARYAGLGFPGGPAIEKLASQSKNYIELPYRVKGMDVALSGILTKLRQMIEKMDTLPPAKIAHSQSSRESIKTVNSKTKLKVSNKLKLDKVNNSKKSRANASNVNYTLSDLAYSMQETVFAMLVETAERALAHTGKKELLLGGGVGCNSRLQEMCKIMCKERGAKFFAPEKSLLVDNGAMIAYLGEIMWKAGIFEKDLSKIDIKPRQRTDDVEVKWRK